MNKAISFRILILAAVAVLVWVYFSPLWWVSLKAPNYPPESFPDGVRIHFHMDGVFNGCELRQTQEIEEVEALNCVHEMNTINHYVGMYPIESAAPVERALSPQLVSFLLVMLLGFMMPGKKSQAAVLALGFAVIAAWLLLMLFSPGGIALTSPGFRAALLFALDLEPYEIKDWTAYYAMLQGYGDSLGVYFRDRVVIDARVAVLSTAIYAVTGLLLGAMLVLVAGVLYNRWFYWLLLLIPLLLPVFFVFDYAAWLWWYGHTLNDMAAFSIKPFMPTVFGDGKVAQFTTHSYPHYGFALMLLSSALLGLAGLLRRKQLREAAV